MRFETSIGLPEPGKPGLFWLGQAGFWIETGRQRILIDPYLSNSLAKKYKGKKHPHLRMMQPPLSVDELPRPDVVLITHGHTDHLDPETLNPLWKRFPDLLFVVPASCSELARDRIGASASLILADADQALVPLDGLSVQVFPAAHEDRKLDGNGHHLFLGYGVAAAGLRIYHSGDCVPFEGLRQRIAEFDPQVLLLPVNGRDAERRADGVPGNFTLQEAIDLAAPYPCLVPHHFGMFTFNTIDPHQIDQSAAETGGRPLLLRPQPGSSITIG